MTLHAFSDCLPHRISLLSLLSAFLFLMPYAAAAPVPESFTDKFEYYRNAPQSSLPRDIPVHHIPGSTVIHHTTRNPGPAGSMLILVETGLYDRISGDLATYVPLLENDGWTIELASWTGTSPVDVRSHLQQKYQDGFHGAWLVGDLPIAYCLLPDDFGYDVFPTDLYYMDLDGDWADTGMTGVFNSHNGHVQPEIWIGRLIASNLTATGQTEPELIREYLSKAAAYRLDNSSAALEGVACADTGFGSDSYQGAEAVTTLFGDCTRSITTDPDVYRNYISESRPWMSLYAHGSPSGHYFEGGVVMADELPTLGINTRFFSVFSCSNSRYTEENYMGGWYVFSPHAPLGLIGSTKTGSLYFVNDLTGPLGEGRCLGAALLHWSVLHSHQNPAWFYGVTLLGDPSLPVLREPCISGYQVTDIQGDPTAPVPGKPVHVTVTLNNPSGLSFTGGLDVLLVSDDPGLTLIDPGPFTLDQLDPGTTGTAGPFILQIAENAGNGFVPDAHLEITWKDLSRQRPFRLAAAAPEPLPGHPFVYSAGGTLEPGDITPLYFPVTNRGSAVLAATTMRLTSLNQWLTFPDEPEYTISLEPDQTVWVGPVRTQLSAACPPGDILPVAVTWNGDNPDETITLVTGGGLCFDPGSGWNGLSHAPATPDTFDQWRYDEIYYYCGRPDDLPYNSGMDAALMLPEIMVTGPAYLDIGHEMQGEPSGDTSAYDGGRVEINPDGEWTVLSPETGYSHVFETGTTAETGSPCWAWVEPGTEHRLMLPVHDTPYAVRFRFVSDGGLAYNGWKIHSIRISGSAVIHGPHPPPPCPRTGVQLLMPAAEFLPGDTCYLDARICNAETNQPLNAPVFFVLEIDGGFWFWPSWADLDYQMMELQPGLSNLTVIEPFTWPSGAGNSNQLYFYGAILNESMTGILGDWDRIGFSFRE